MDTNIPFMLQLLCFLNLVKIWLLLASYQINESLFALPCRVYQTHPGSNTQRQILTAHVVTRHPPYLFVLVSYLSLRGTREARALWQDNCPISRTISFPLFLGVLAIVLCGWCLIVHCLRVFTELVFLSCPPVTWLSRLWLLSIVWTPWCPLVNTFVMSKSYFTEGI